MKPAKTLIGERLFLGPVDIDRTEDYYHWINDLNIGMNIGMGQHPISYPKEEEILEGMSKKGHNFGIYLLDGERLIGNCSLFDVNAQHRTAILGIFIGDGDNRGKGYGTEALELLTEYGFRILNLHNIMLQVFSFNKAGIRCYEKVGFKIIGKRRESYLLNGISWDQITMDMLEGEMKSTYLRDVFPKA